MGHRGRDGWVACAYRGGFQRTGLVVSGYLPLYHYTCDHGLRDIRSDDWLVRPNEKARTLLVLYGVPCLAWFTDMAVPDARALGLTSRTIECVRVAHRLTAVEDADLLPWVQWCHLNRYPWHLRDVIESAEGAKPRRWWVSERPVKVAP